MGDIEIKLTSRLDKDGYLVIEQLMTNAREDYVDFNCYLFAKGVPRQRSQVYRLGANEDRKIYRYPRGKALLGTELLFEAVEIDGPRVLKYNFVATP